MNDFERAYLCNVEEKQARVSTTDTGEFFLVWGEVLQYEVKEVSDHTGNARLIEGRYWGMVTPNTKWKKYVSS